MRGTLRCPVEYLNILQSTPVLKLFFAQKRLNSIVYEPVFIPGKIICEKKQKQFPVKITFP